MEKIVIDAGHGGIDPGASGNGIVEKDYNLLISKYMYDRFKKLGIPVTLIRDEDITLTPTERTERVLNAYGNSPDVIVISNHLNAGGGDGAEVIYALRNTSALSNKILNNLELAGQNVRKVYQRRLPSDTSKDYYFMQRDTGNTESIIVEYGFVDSTGDDPNQIKNNYEKYAEAVVESVASYINVPYTKEDGNYYTVKAGDSLYSIANKYGVSIVSLKSINNLTTNLLNIGQVLNIPEKEEEKVEIITTGTYEVKAGDTLYNIAAMYNMTVNELKELNNLTNNTLSIGQILKVSEVEEITNENIYVVQKGDSLYSIAKKYNATVNELKEINNLTTNMLDIGQILIVPNINESNIVTYTVKSGDTLYSIARKYNTSVDEIKKLNNMSNNLLSLNQVLKIPK